MYITDEIVLDIIKNIEKDSHEKNMDYFCVSRDIFQARVDTFVNRTNRYLESAIIGEIGNNTFDHNWDFDKEHVRGTYFNYEFINGIVVLADFGRGIRESLSLVKKFADDLEALKSAFTEEISGRAPEQRGNGLKFVAENMINNKWSLYFQSGDACCIIENGNISFIKSKISVIGCLAILSFMEC